MEESKSPELTAAAEVRHAEILACRESQQAAPQSSAGAAPQAAAAAGAAAAGAAGAVTAAAGAVEAREEVVVRPATPPEADEYGDLEFTAEVNDMMALVEAEHARDQAAIAAKVAAEERTRIEDQNARARSIEIDKLIKVQEDILTSTKTGKQGRYS